MRAGSEAAWRLGQQRVELTHVDEFGLQPRISAVLEDHPGRRGGRSGTDGDVQAHGAQIDAVAVVQALLGGAECVDLDSVLAVQIGDHPALAGARHAGVMARDTLVLEHQVAVLRTADQQGVLPHDHLALLAFAPVSEPAHLAVARSALPEFIHGELPSEAAEFAPGRSPVTGALGDGFLFTYREAGRFT